MAKIKVVINTIIYPVAISRYFWDAFLRRKDIELKVVGPFTGRNIPWKGNMILPEHYVRVPDIILPVSFIGNIQTPPEIALAQLRKDGFEPDLWVNIDAGYNCRKPNIKGQVVNIFTDPHVLNYDYQRTQADLNFNMQASYMKQGDRLLVYAADPVYHAPLEREKEYDACISGLQYPNRVALVNRLRARGLNVYSDIGKAYHDYQEIYAKSKVALSWSSLDDLIARVFEAGLMAVPLVSNRVSDISTHFVEDEHYLGFSDLQEAEEKVMWALANYDDAQDMAWAMHRVVQAKHLYDYRVSDILKACKLT